MNRTLLLIGIAGFLGTVCRYLLSSAFAKASDQMFPYSTLIINVSGCFLIGIIYAITLSSDLVSNETSKILTIGFCGGFTTFSAFAFENVKLIQQSQYSNLFIYCLASVGLGIIAVLAGTYFGKLMT